MLAENSAWEIYSFEGTTMGHT